MTTFIKKRLLGIRSFRNWLVEYLLAIFRLPSVRDEVSKVAGAFVSEAGRFSSGIKGEAAGTMETFLILSKYIRKEKMSRSEKKKFKRNVVNMLKSTGVVIPVMLIPLPFVSTLLLILMDHLLLSMNIRILPSSFYPKEPKPLLTREAVDRDLEKSLGHNNTEATY